MVVAFSVKAPRSVEVAAAQNQVPIYSSTIIYRLMDDIRSRVIALLPPIIETKVVGEATILQLFDISVKGKLTKKIAGCRVTNGVVDKSKIAKVIRNGATVHEGNTNITKLLTKTYTLSQAH